MNRKILCILLSGTAVFNKIDNDTAIKTKVFVLTEKPSFPIPTDIFLKNKRKPVFPPPKMERINSKPKGKFRK